MKKNIDIDVDLRNPDNKENILGVIYGKNCPNNLLIEMTPKIAESFIFRGVFSSLFTINLNGEKYHCLIKEIQRHPISSKVIHIDFFSVNLSDEIKIKAEIKCINMDKCEAIKAGAILNIASKNVDIFCRADSITPEIVIDVENLKAGYTVFSDEIKGIKFPERIILLSLLANEETKDVKK